MHFVKYCKEKHNIALSSQTLRLGTLKYYRDLDHDFLGDAYEGRLQATFGNPNKPKKLTQREADILFRGSGVTIKGLDRGLSMTIKGGGGVSVTKWSPNCFVFCCKIQSNLPNANGVIDYLDSGYDSWYEVRDRDKFSN